MDKPSLSDQANRAPIPGTRVAIAGLIVAILGLIYAYFGTATVKIDGTTVVKIDETQFKQMVPPTKPVVERPPVMVKPTTPSAPKPTPPASEENNPLRLTDKQSTFSKLADADVSAEFNSDQYGQLAVLTITPLGKKSASLSMLGTYGDQSLSFESKTGEYIANVLNVDFENKILEIRVSKKNGSSLNRVGKFS